MKDIKVKKVSVNKIAEKVEKKVVVQAKKQFDFVPAILFGLMTTSVICYIFLVSSSVFYAVKTSQYEYKTEKIATSIVNTLNTEEFAMKTSSGRISYINQDNSVAISLK